MKRLLPILLLFVCLHTQAQTKRYSAWRSDSTRRYDSVAHHYDTAYTRLRPKFRMAIENYNNAKTKLDSAYWLKIVETFRAQLQPLEYKHEEEKHHWKEENLYKP